MSTLDVVTIVAFAAVILAGLAALVLADAARQRPRHRLRERLRQVSGMSRSPSHARILADLQRARTEARRRRRRESLGGLGYYLNRMDTVTGAGGGRRLALGVGAVAILGFLVLALGLVPVNAWSAFGLIVAAPTLVGIVAYRWILGRFRKGFLTQLPDAMDMIVRASRAGIPATQSVRLVGRQFDAPLGPEFRRMGDNLLLGNDLQEVLDDAVLRISLPDFTFFSVCLSLQRESGGSVVEALENLAGIIRARRDLALKARALTAEGRASGAVLSILPFLLIALLYAVNRPYVEILFTTETGRQLLWVAAGMLSIGLFAIRRLTRMEV